MFYSPLMFYICTVFYNKIILATDKNIINDKFREVYQALINQEEIIPGSKGDRSLLSFALKIGTEEHAIGLWLAGQVDIPTNCVIKLCQEYNVNRDYMFGDTTNIFSLVGKKAGNIIWVEGIEFFCGTGELTQNRNFRRYDDYSVNGEFWAFRASGDSMEKTIYSGDVVYAVKLERPDYINRNDICAIAKTNDEALMKRVKSKIYNKKGYLTHLILLSDNEDSYPDEIRVSVSHISQIFRVEEVRSKNLSKIQ